MLGGIATQSKTCCGALSLQISSATTLKSRTFSNLSSLMATLPYNTTSTSHLHGPVNRVPLFSNEALSFCKHKKQALPTIAYLKQKSSLDFAERTTPAKLEYKQLSPERVAEYKADSSPQARQEYEQLSSEEETEHVPQANFSQGSDNRSSDKTINTVRTQDANRDAFTSMAVEIGSAILKVDHGNAVSLNGNGAPSSHKAQLKENLPQSFEEHWQFSNEEEANSLGQSSVLDTGEEAGNSLSSELSSSLNEAELPRGERREQFSSSKVSVSSSPSAVTLKKPITVSRPIYEITDTTEPPGALSDSNEDSSASVMSTGSGLPDLTTGLQALRRLIFRKHFDLAKDLAKKLYGQYPGDTDVLMEYAFVERQRGDLVAAGALYSQAISTYEDQNNLGYDYVRALQALGSIEAHARNARKARVLFMESIRAARQGERLFPGMVSGASVYGLHAWARLEEKLGNWSKARDLLARAAGIQPGNAVIHHSRALLEAKAHNWGAARHHFLLAVEAAPSDLKCWHAWAIFEGSQGHHGKMRLLFQRALEVDPKSVHCLQAWAHQETLIGTKESKQTARSLFERCVQMEPKSLHSWQAWAVMESASRNYDKARELFEKCLEINPSSVVSLQAFATMERNLGNLCAAQRLLRKALKLEPENAAVLMEAAFVEKGLGNMEVAERLFVLAGMADKRKSRVRNKIFHSRKEVMPHKAGDKLWRAFAKKNVEKSKSGSNLESVIEAIKAKQQEVESDRDVNTDEQSSSKPREGGRKRQVWTPNRSGA